MPDTALHFSEVTFGFDRRKPLFEDLTCSFASSSGTGKIIALMGPSGVGKSTFCDLSLGIRKPQKGSITFEPDNANIAVIPQKAVLFNELNVLENISCLKYSKTLGNSFKEQRIQHAVDSLGLTDVLKNATKTSALSGGEAQRVMLARIQTINCDVLILDEPCSFLDNRVKDSFLTALRAIVDESGLLALMVTHVWEEARLVADDVLFFNQEPGKPVSLHCQTVSEAQRHPPTIDALYGIHWPDCLVLDLNEADLQSDFSTIKIPFGASFVGLHAVTYPHSFFNEWASELWNKSFKTTRNIVGRLSTVTNTSNNDAQFSANFYNHYGALIESDV